MEKYENIDNYFPQEENVNYRKIILVILNKWHLFVLFGLLGVFFGYLYSRYSKPNYQVNASIYVPKKSASIETGLEGLFDSQLTDSKVEVYNQIEILKSFNINYKVAQNLNWRTSWFKKEQLNWDNLIKQKDIFAWTALYKDEPFHVEEILGAFNNPGICLYMKQLSDKQYEITVNGEVTYNGAKKTIKFVKTGTFGVPFENDFFHFILTPNKIEAKPGCSYYFVFSESAQIANNYLKNMVVQLNDKNSAIIRLQVLGPLPERDIDYLNQLIQVYMQNKMNYQTETQKRSLQFVDEQLVGISDSLNSAGNNFSQFKSQNQIINIGEQGKQVVMTLKDIESDKSKNQMQLDYFRNLLDYLGKSDDIKQLIAPSIVGIQDASLNTLVLGLSELYSRRQILSFSAKENNPTLLMIDKEILQTNARLKENLRNLIKDAEVLNNSFEVRIKDMGAQINRLPKKEQNFINYQRRFELTNEIYTFLLQKRAEMNIALAGATPEVQIIDAARIETTEPVGLSSMKKILIGLFLGLAFPGVVLIIYSFFANTIESQDDVEKNTKLPVLGTVIHSSTKSDTPVNDNPRSGIAESYRTLRTNLQFMLSVGNHKIVAIHSTNPSEGKSFTSVNLATILAMNNKKVILVVCDMRKPRLHKILKVQNDKGLSTYLSDQDQLEDVILESYIDKLYILPAGPIPPNPSELIDQPKMEELLKSLSEKFDYVILDNAPISLVTDGLLSGRHADLNIFILRYDVSKIDQIKYINQIAENKILGNLALIINDISGPGFGYGRNYYYNYKYKDYENHYYEESEPKSKFKKMFGRG